MKPLDIFKALKPLWKTDCATEVLTLKSVHKLHTDISLNESVATHLVIGSSVWLQMISIEEFQQYLDAEINTGRLFDGYIAKLFEMEVLCDAYLPPNYQSVPKDMIACVAMDGNVITHVALTKIKKKEQITL